MYSEDYAIDMLGTKRVKLGKDLSARDQETAKAGFVYRYTLDNIPEWAKELRPDGTHYMPHFASDQEWLNNTWFAVASDGRFLYRSVFCCGAAQFPFGKEEQYLGQLQQLIASHKRA